MKNNDGQSPLDLASENGHQGVVDFLKNPLASGDERPEAAVGSQTKPEVIEPKPEEPVPEKMVDPAIPQEKAITQDPQPPVVEKKPLPKTEEPKKSGCCLLL